MDRPVPILNQCVDADGGDDDHAAEDGPLGGAFADEEEDPDGVEERFDEADDAGVEGPRSASYAFNKQDV